MASKCCEALEEECDGLRDDVERLEDRVQELEKDADRAGELDLRVEELEEEVEELENKLKRERDDLERDLEEEMDARKKAEARCTRKMAKYGDVKDALFDAQQRIEDLALQLSESTQREQEREDTYKRGKLLREFCSSPKTASDAGETELYAEVRWAGGTLFFLRGDAPTRLFCRILARPFLSIYAGPHATNRVRARR